MALHLIADRTLADVQRAEYLNTRDVRDMTAEEIDEITSGLKCAMDDVMYNRVESAVWILAETLAVHGYNLTLDIKTDWTPATEYTVVDMDRYLNNVKALKAAFYGTIGLPDTMRGLTHDAANAIEQLLLEIEDNINRLYLSAWLCGEGITGESTL